MNVPVPPVLKATIATITGFKKDPVKNRYWVHYCRSCWQPVGIEVNRCNCGHTSFVDLDDQVELQFSGWELVCAGCQAQTVGVGNQPCSCGCHVFRIIKPRYALNVSR